MTASNFPTRIRHVQPNDPVSASATSAAPKVLEARTNMLKEVVDAIEAGRALLWRDQTVDASVQEGQPVFWNYLTQQFEQARATAAQSPTTGGFTTGPESEVFGLCLTKKVGNRADIVISGVVAFNSLAAAIDGDITPGRYYLSAAEPGKLVLQRPPVTVAVAIVLGPLDSCDQNTWVYVLPQTRDFLENHIHYQFSLTARPAGLHVPPTVGEPHTISDADSSLPGWLPADDAIFNGTAPTGAKFGYNLSAEPNLNGMWPPIPLSAVVLEWFRPCPTPEGSDTGCQPLVGGRVPAGKVQFNADGIWWMTDCYDEVPWPTDLDTTPLDSSSVSVSSSSSSVAPDYCPQVLPMELVLSFIKMTFATDKTVVTSLQPGEGQPIEFVNCDGDAATTGDLFARLRLEFLLDDDEYYGGIALKGVTTDNQFKTGYMVEGLIAGDASVTLTGTRQRRLTPGDTTTPTVHQGIVTVIANVDPVDKELLPQITRLGDAAERFYAGLTFIGFPNGRTSSIRAMFMVPFEGLPEIPRVRFRIWIFGRASGTLTDLTTTYCRVARPTDGSPTSIVEGDTAVTLATDITVVANQIHELESEEITVEPGDLLYFEIARPVGGSPVYANEIGIVRVGAMLVAGG